MTREIPSLQPPEPLSDEDRRTLLVVARRSLEEALSGNPVSPPAPESPRLLEPRGAFVSLHHKESGRLRGCLGEFLAQRPLIESVAEMAIAAATRDPRFPAVTLEELSDLRVEISALTPLVPIHPRQVRVGIHGLLILHGSRRGLLLPHVAPAHGWNRQEYLSNLCLKAGLVRDDWRSEEVELQAFEAEVWEED